MKEANRGTNLRNAERHTNPDPITNEPGAHPIGTGVGAVAGGAAGAAAGAAIGGPVGAGIGIVAARWLGEPLVKAPPKRRIPPPWNRRAAFGEITSAMM